MPAADVPASGESRSENKRTATATGTDLTQAVPLLAAAAVAVIAVRHTGRPYLAVVAGMPTLWLLTWAVGAS